MKIGPKYKIARRLGAQIFEKTQTAKFKLREGRKGMKNSKRPRSVSDFGRQLIEKQKVRVAYGIPERQFGRYIRETISKKGQKQDQVLYGILETRLDNVVYRFGLAPTRLAARQMVSHGHITVNGRRTLVPSFAVKIGDVVGIRAASLSSPLFQNLEERLKDRSVVSWLAFNLKDRTGKITANPPYEASKEFLDLAAVLDFYKR